MTKIVSSIIEKQKTSLEIDIFYATVALNIEFPVTDINHKHDEWKYSNNPTTYGNKEQLTLT